MGQVIEAHGLLLRHLFTMCEISQEHVPIRVHEDIMWFDISVAHSILLAIVESFYNLSELVLKFLLLDFVVEEASDQDLVVEGAIPDVVHGHANCTRHRVVIVKEHVMDVEDPLMLEALDQLYLLEDFFPGCGSVRLKVRLHYHQLSRSAVDGYSRTAFTTHADLILEMKICKLLLTLTSQLFSNSLQVSFDLPVSWTFTVLPMWIDHHPF